MISLETRKRDRTVSTLEGGVLSLTNHQNLVRLAGQNLKGQTRVWKLRLVAEPASNGSQEQNLLLTSNEASGAAGTHHKRLRMETD